MNWRAALRTRFDEERFTNLMAEAWREQPIVASVDILSLMRLRIRFRGETDRETTLSLHHLWNALRINHRTPREWQVQQYMQRWLDYRTINVRVQAEDVFNVLPGLLTRNVLDAGAAPDLLMAPVVGDLCLAFQIERNEHRFYLNRGNLDEQSFPLSRLKALAFENLGQRYGRAATWYDYGEGVGAFGVQDTDYGCTLLADEGVWRSVRASLNIHRLVAAAPCRYRVMFADADNKASVRQLASKVEEIYFNGTDTPLSPAVFVRDDGPWAPWLT